MIKDGNSYLVEQNGQWGWCDKNGKLTINPQFNLALPFLGNKLAVVNSGGKYGFINKSGKFIVNPQFDFALPYNNKSSLVRSSDKYGFIDRKGTFTVNPQFDNVSDDLINYLLGRASGYFSSSPFKDKSISGYNLNQYNGLLSTLQVDKQYDKNLTSKSDKWRVFLEEGKVYAIDMMSNDFDAILGLFDTKENLILEDYDSGDGYDARIYFVPSVTGIYILKCLSGGEEVGNYSVKVETIPTKSLDINATGRGSLNRNSPKLNGRSSQIWTVYLEGSSYYQIDLISREFDSYLTLLLNGKVISENDDGGSGRNSRISLTAPASGYYTIYASSYRGSGQYSLSVQRR